MGAVVALEQHVQRRSFLEPIQVAIVHNVNVPPGVAKVLEGVQTADPAELAVLVDVDLWQVVGHLGAKLVDGCL